MTRNDLQPLIETIEAVAEAIRSAATSARPSRPWLGLQEMATDYVPLSERTLRKLIAHPTHPLPVRRVGGKWISHVDELDTWLRSFPKAGDELERIVEEVMRDF
jgi:hypothetical protein